MFVLVEYFDAFPKITVNDFVTVRHFFCVCVCVRRATETPGGQKLDI